MTCLCKVEVNTALRCVCVAVVLVVLAGDVATLAYGYHHGVSGGNQDDGWLGLEVVQCGVVLCSVLLPLALGCLLPEKSSVLCRLWLAVHVTWSDDLARHAVLLLRRLQVNPVLDALGLSAALDNLDYWWWCLQGLLLVALIEGLASSYSPREGEFEGEADDEVTEVVVGYDRLAPRE